LRETILLGREDEITPFPAEEWKLRVVEAPERIRARLDFMSDDHHRIRNFVVRELPKIGKPLSPAFIADRLRIPLSRTREILDQLEEHLFFHVRDDDGAVSWAFPVTAEETPHRLVFNTGERLYAA
jgi:hypothetical protein